MLGKILKLLPVSPRLLLIVWPFLVIVAVLVWMFVQSMVVLGSTRSYSEGESNWSKGQKQAVFHLLHFAQTRQEADYEFYRRAIAVPLAFKRFRVEMHKANPDMPAVYQALRDGLTHPDDVEPGIEFFRRFHKVRPMADVVTVWEEGDALIDELNTAAAHLHAAISRGDASERQIQSLIGRILDINAQLTPMEQRFTKSLGDASRQAKFILILVMFSSAGVLVPIGVLLSHRMVKHREAFEEALKISEERFNLAVAGSNDGLFDWKIRSDELYCSPRFAQLLCHGEGGFDHSMRSIAKLVHPGERKAAMHAVRSHLRSNAVLDIELRMCSKQGEYRWFRVRGQSVRLANGTAVRMAGSLTDITYQRIAAAELFAEKERALVTLASIADGVITTDTNGWIEYLNPVAQQLTGWSMEKARGLPIQALLRLINEANQRTAPNPIERVLNEERTVELGGNMLLVRNDGVRIPIAHSAAPIRDRAGNITGVVLVLHDVSRERHYAAKLSYQASHDALTGLINRTEFERRLDLALQSAAQDGRHHAVMYLDLDQFKVVNDTCGHAAGDQLLRQVSTLLQTCLREADTLARLGGDEFGVLLENCSPENAVRIADKLRQTVTDFHYAWSNMRFNIGVSIGVVNIEDGLYTLAEVLRAADAACYMAKEKGRNRVQVYHRDDSELCLRQGEMEWVGRLQKALDENRFVLYAQDIVAVNGQQDNGTHCELLIRMIDEHGAIVPPVAFIPAAERYNLMPAIDRWVVRTALVIWRACAPSLAASRSVCARSICPVLPSETSASSNSCAISSGSFKACTNRSASRSLKRQPLQISTRPGASFKSCGRWVAAFLSTISAPACRHSLTSSICRWTTSRSTVRS